MKAVFIEGHGGVEVLRHGERPRPEAEAGNALIRVAAAGVNFIDTYHRTGLYKVELPFILGQEGAGTVEAVGEGVNEVAVGDRVAWAMQGNAYAEYAAIPAWKLVKLPPEVSFEEGAAAMLQGMTAHYLTHSTWPLKQGEKCLVHAAAGGTGLLIVQMAKLLGARVYATAGTDEKAEIARKAGADEAIVYTREDFAARAKGMDVVYDSVGKSTFEGSLNCLRPRGMMVSFGNASGPVPDISPLLLTQKGSLFLTRPSLAHYAATREEIVWRAGDILRWMGEKKLKVSIGGAYPLAEAAAAHRDLESRKTSGKLILVP